MVMSTQVCDYKTRQNNTNKHKNQKNIEAEHLWPVIIAAWEAGIRRITVGAHHLQIICKVPFAN
jgi:hypothetical protein